MVTRVTPAVGTAAVDPVSAAPAMETLTPMLWATVTRKLMAAVYASSNQTIKLLK